jgi:hypothetical protein
MVPMRLQISKWVQQNLSPLYSLDRACSHTAAALALRGCDKPPLPDLRAAPRQEKRGLASVTQTFSSASSRGALVAESNGDEL